MANFLLRLDLIGVFLDEFRPIGVFYLRFLQQTKRVFGKKDVLSP